MLWNSISICIGIHAIVDRLDQQSQRTIFECSRDAAATSESTNGKKRAVIFEAMTLIVQMIQSVTSIFQLLAALLIFIYEGRASSSANLIDTELKYKSCASVFQLKLKNKLLSIAKPEFNRILSITFREKNSTSSRLQNKLSSQFRGIWQKYSNTNRI